MCQGTPRPFEVCVYIVKSNQPPGTGMLWDRTLHRDGTWTDTQGYQHDLDTDPETWLSVVLLAARDEQLRLIGGA